MYRVMVVEDSKPILRNIVNQIRHASDRVDVVATASNGNEALNRLRTVPVDLVFSDIKMPVMSGLDFLDEARRSNPALRCVIISGYDDFEFARRAIQIRVDEYVLKPVVEDELRALLGRIVASLDQERLWVFQNELAAALKGGARTFDPPNDLLEKGYGICLMRSGALRDGSVTPNRVEVAAALREALGAEAAIICAETRHWSETAVLVDLARMSDENWRNACSQAHERLVRAGHIARMACSSGHEDVRDVPARVSFLSRFLECRVFLEESTFVVADDRASEAFRPLSHEDLMRFREEARFVASARTAKDFRRHVEAIVRSWRDQRRPLVVVRQLLGAIVEALNETSDNAPGNSVHPADADEILASSRRYEEIADELCAAYEAMLARKNIDGASSERIADAAVKFIRDNVYREISMSDVAARLGVSTSYIYRILQTTLGKPPMEYYHELKISEAKKLMDRYPELKVKQIAESLSFHDVHYFSRVFKAHVSVSPAEYRRRSKGVELGT